MDVPVSAAGHSVQIGLSLLSRREPSFGHGVLELVSAVEATWTWHKNQDSVAVPSDTVTVRRNLRCPNQESR